MQKKMLVFNLWEAKKWSFSQPRLCSFVGEDSVLQPAVKTVLSNRILAKWAHFSAVASQKDEAGGKGRVLKLQLIHIYNAEHHTSTLGQQQTQIVFR